MPNGSNACDCCDCCTGAASKEANPKSSCTEDAGAEKASNTLGFAKVEGTVGVGADTKSESPLSMKSSMAAG